MPNRKQRAARSRNSKAPKNQKSAMTKRTAKQ
jgi:hypothetical protein